MKTIILIAALFVTVTHAKDVLVSCRFVGFEPAKNGITSLVATGKDGKPETIALTVDAALSKPVVLKSDKGVITFRIAEAAPAVAATAIIPATAKDAFIVFVPTEKAELVVGTLVMDASAKAFPPGATLILNHCPNKAKVTVGETVIDLKPDESAPVAWPKVIDEFNMVSVKAEVEIEGAWRTAFESNLRFVKTQRNLFVAYIDHTTKRPRFWTFQE